MLVLVHLNQGKSCQDTFSENKLISGKTTTSETKLCFTIFISHCSRRQILMSGVLPSLNEGDLAHQAQAGPAWQEAVAQGEQKRCSKASSKACQLLSPLKTRFSAGKRLLYQISLIKSLCPLFELNVLYSGLSLLIQKTGERWMSWPPLL